MNALTDKMAGRLELWPVNKLIAYEFNARTHSDEQVEKIAASIAEFGFNSPILVDEHDNTIIAGHGRLLAAERLGMREVPVIPLAHLTEAQRRAYIIADNQLADLSGWDEAMLAHELAALASEGDLDLRLTGFDADEIAAFVGDQLVSPSETNSGAGEVQQPEPDSIYTKKITTPIYEPTGVEPDISELYDATKHEELLAQINQADIPEEVRQFLVLASYRHVKVNYKNAAEFYAHTKDEQIRKLFQASALVIIDYNAAIENGYVMLSERLMSLSGHDLEAGKDE